MLLNLEIKIESAKPLSEAMKNKWPAIAKSINFETAASTIMYLSEILELYDNSESVFKIISWTGANMYWVCHDEFQPSILKFIETDIIRLIQIEKKLTALKIT